MTYFAYLDEFGHVGPYVARTDPKYRESPVFGLAGFVLPADEVRGFGTWFYQRKCELLAFEIARSGKHPALWEKKGAVSGAGEAPGFQLDGGMKFQGRSSSMRLLGWPAAIFSSVSLSQA